MFHFFYLAKIATGASDGCNRWKRWLRLQATSEKRSRIAGCDAPYIIDIVHHLTNWTQGTAEATA